MTTSNESTKLSQKTLNSVFWRWFLWGQIGWNYEKMQGSGYCFSMMPALKEIYKGDDDALQEAVENHLQFFNTTPHTAFVILGINCAVEPELKLSGKEAIAGIKTGLMGPFAGVGDSIFGVIIPTIFGSIAAYMALSGNPVGSFIWIIAGVVTAFIRWWLFKLGYTQGQSAVDTIAENMKPITDAAGILGLVVVGALICTVVAVTAPGTFAMGDVNQKVQDLLDGIMPGLLPLCVTAFVYWLLSRKGMTSNKAIVIVIVIGLVLRACPASLASASTTV